MPTYELDPDGQTIIITETQTVVSRQSVPYIQSQIQSYQKEIADCNKAIADLQTKLNDIAVAIPQITPLIIK